jgi:hypothetical protein
MESPLHSDNALTPDLLSSHSHDRPRSQANTGSRMMPPLGSISHHIGQDKISPVAVHGDRVYLETNSKLNHISPVLGDNHTKFVHQSSPKVEQSRSLGSRSINREHRDGSTSSSSDSDLIKKRKNTSGQIPLSKRQRESSQSRSLNASYGVQPRYMQLPHPTGSQSPAINAMRSRLQGSPLLLPASPTRDSHFQAQDPSSSISTQSGGQSHRRKPVSRSPSHPSSSSKSSRTTRQPRVYGHHQTRSRSKSFPQSQSRAIMLTMSFVM